MLALTGCVVLLSGQTLGLLPRQGMAQPVLLLLPRRSWLGRLAAFGRRTGTLGWWLCPQGGRPGRGRVVAGSRMLAGRRGAPPSLPGRGGREQVQAFVLEAQPVSTSPPGLGRAGCCWGALSGAWFSLGVCAAFKEPTSRQRSGGGLRQGKQSVPRAP